MEKQQNLELTYVVYNVCIIFMQSHRNQVELQKLKEKWRRRRRWWCFFQTCLMFNLCLNVTSSHLISGLESSIFPVLMMFQWSILETLTNMKQFSRFSKLARTLGFSRFFLDHGFMHAVCVYYTIFSAIHIFHHQLYLLEFKIWEWCEYMQVINHGVSEDLMDETMNVVEEFFNLPGEYKERFYSQDITKPCRIYSSTLAYDTEEFHYWRDNFTHRCHPLEDNIHCWPEKPTEYR